MFDLARELNKVAEERTPGRDAEHVLAVGEGVKALDRSEQSVYVRNRDLLIQYSKALK